MIPKIFLASNPTFVNSALDKNRKTKKLKEEHQLKKKIK